MGRPSRSDLATPDTVDWSFLERPGLMEKLQAKAGYCATKYGLDADDVFQEACLWLAAHPRTPSQSDALIIGDVVTVARDMGRKVTKRREREVAFDDDGPSDDEP